MRKFLLTTFVFVFSVVQLMAQERTVTGKVTSAEEGSSLPGVSVVLKGTAIGTVTDADGNFSLNVPVDGTLTFSFIGLKSVDVSVNNRTTIDTKMESDVKQLSEVVIVGYQTIKKSELSGSVGSVGGKSIENLPIPSFDRAIQGRMAGVQINASNGVPGGNTQVRIRGMGSVSGSNEPLYIVDGVQMTGGDRSRRLISSNILNGINPNDIESIDVLKDAAAASIYGAQAANGVVIITTKKGKAGATKFNVNYYYGQTDIIKKQPLVNSQQYLEIYQEGQENFYAPYNIIYGENFNKQIAYTTTQVNFGEASALPSYDWQNLVTRRGDIHNVDISANGGNEKNNFYISGSFNKQNSHFIATDFTRASLKINFDNKLSSKTLLQTRVNLSTVDQNTQGVAGFNTNNALVGAIGRLPMANPFLSNGQVNPTLTYAAGALGNNSNPLWLSKVNTQPGTTNQLLANIALDYNITEDLIFRSSYGLEYSVIDEAAFFHPQTPGGSTPVGSYAQFNTKTVNLQTDQTLTYTKTLNDRHSVNGILGFTFRNQVTDGFNAAGQAVANPQLDKTLVGTTAQTVSSVFGQFKIAGVFGRVNYVLDDKYIASVTLRRDGSSRFGEGKKFGWFPAISAGWRISKENFMSDLGFVDELKLRASYGVTGNQEFNLGLGAADFPFSLFGTGTAFGYNGAGGLSFTNLGNPNLQWETNKTLDIGLDFEFVNSRVTGSVDYFIKTTENLLLPQILPSNSGFATITENVGEMENRGWEFGVSTQNLVGEFKWSTDFNISFIKNEVTKLLIDGEDLPNNGLWLGRPFGSIFVARYAGVNPSDGRAMWYDINGSITYDPQEGDRVFIERGSGSALMPEYFGGITNTFSYKGFELSGFFQFNVGQLAQSQFKANSSMDLRFDTNQDEEVMERWQRPGDITDVPRIMPGAQEVGSANSLFGGSIASHDRFWEDATYIRLKQISLAYQFPSSIISKLKLSSARIYISGVNLWTQTEFTGLDPEFATSTNANGVNSNNTGTLPPNKSIIAGVQFGF